MSLNVNGNISDIYVGEDKIDSVYVGEDLVYSSVPVPDLDYFYFQIDDPAQTAEVGIREWVDYSKSKSEATNVPLDRSKLIDYEVPTFEYSFNKRVWVNYTLGDSIYIGYEQIADKVYFRGDNLTRWYQKYYEKRTETISGTETEVFHRYGVSIKAFIKSTYVKCGGNIMSLRYKDFENQYTLPCEACFTVFFYSCSLLKEAPRLPATNLTPYCYGGYDASSQGTEGLEDTYSAIGMFYGCASLALPPTLPATTLAKYCYSCMFQGCTSLTSAPALPATTLAEGCYYKMFYGCTSLTSPPTLPATTLANRCYSGMFCDCTSLISAPALPVTTLADRCYYEMFYGCTSLTSPPTLPATTLANRCYSGMFCDCTSLISAPALPATILAEFCYGGGDIFNYGMFQGCTSLTSAPALPATTLAKYCYNSMFKGCTKLTRIPKLKATTLPDYCYQEMFSGVKAAAKSATGITKAYRIPTSGTGTAGSKSLESMFAGSAGTDVYTPSINTTFYISATPF